MTMPKFKKGDRVRVTCNNSAFKVYDENIGETGHIDELNTSRKYGHEITMESSGKRKYFNDDELELVESPDTEMIYEDGGYYISQDGGVFWDKIKPAKEEHPSVTPDTATERLKLPEIPTNKSINQPTIMDKLKQSVRGLKKNIRLRRKHGVEDVEGNLTAYGREVYLQYLWQQDKDGQKAIDAKIAEIDEDNE